MAEIIGMFIGAILGTALFSALLAWVLRKIAPLTVKLSYIIALFVVMVLGAWSYSTNGNVEMTFVGALAFYGVAAVLAYFILMATHRNRLQKNPEFETGQLEVASGRYRIWSRSLGWMLFVLTVAIGATAIFNATRAYGDAGTFSFFIGAISLACSFLIWRKLSAVRP